MRKLRKLRLAVLPSALALALAAVLPAYAAGDTLVTVGSPKSPFAQNKQNEPAVTVDPTNPNVLVAGSNDEIDLEACAAGDPTRCPFTQGVGLSGVYFSSNGGKTWTQPTYTGWSARGCLGPQACSPVVGPIGTLPFYFENGLVSDGDPALAFGPRPDASGRFSWSNGSRLYYANLTSNFATTRSDQAFSGFEAIAVSRTDDVAAAAAGKQSAWMQPVIVSKQNAVLFSDKEAVWADDAASSPFFGNVYTCNASFRGLELVSGFPEPVLFTRSQDGGSTWDNPQQLSAAVNNNTVTGRQDCTVRTDSKGTVYVYWDGSTGSNGQLGIFQTRSFDGGASFERPRAVATYTNCGVFDPNNGVPSFDGVAGARTSSEPSVDIANGAPSGAGASNEIVLAFCDGATPTDTAPGPNEKVRIRYSTDGGSSFNAGSDNAAVSSDRPDFPAIAISPNGATAYLVYDAYLQPWQSNTALARRNQGVVRSAAIGAGGAPGAWSTRLRAAVGDARGSSANSLGEGFLGDYNYAAASNVEGYAVWNDTRNAADCPAIDAYREGLLEGTSPSRPAPNSDCPATFGDSDIFGGAFTP